MPHIGIVWQGHGYENVAASWTENCPPLIFRRITEGLRCAVVMVTMNLVVVLRISLTLPHHPIDPDKSELIKAGDSIMTCRAKSGGTFLYSIQQLWSQWGAKGRAQDALTGIPMLTETMAESNSSHAYYGSHITVCSGKQQPMNIPHRSIDILNIR